MTIDVPSPERSAAEVLQRLRQRTAVAEFSAACEAATDAISPAMNQSLEAFAAVERQVAAARFDSEFMAHVHRQVAAVSNDCSVYAGVATASATAFDALMSDDIARQFADAAAFLDAIDRVPRIELPKFEFPEVEALQAIEKSLSNALARAFAPLAQLSHAIQDEPELEPGPDLDQLTRAFAVALAGCYVAKTTDDLAKAIRLVPVVVLASKRLAQYSERASRRPTAAPARARDRSAPPRPRPSASSEAANAPPPARPALFPPTQGRASARRERSVT